MRIAACPKRRQEGIMIKDKRKSRRQLMRYTALILLGPGQMQGCVLHDVSDSGARLEVEDGDKVPDRFFLMLSRRGKVRRVCRVIWRKPTQLGVKFERSFAEIDAKPAPTPQPAVAAEPELAG
jgi:PilZ domain